MTLLLPNQSERVFALQQDFVSYRKTQFYIDRIGAAAQRFATI
jgi:hypothetical protein